MATRCFAPVRGRRMRVTRTDNCGRPIYGPCSQVVTDGFISVALTAVQDEGEAIDVRNAAGDRCVYEPACPTLLGYTAVIQFCRVDPDVFSMLTGQSTIVDPQSGDTIGFKISTAVRGCDFGFALELWTGVPGVQCAPGDAAAGQWGYLLLPFLQGGIFGDFTIENGAVTFQVTGAATKDGSGWGVGPYNVTTDADGQPGPLNEPVEANDHLELFLTSVPPPEPMCGCQPLAETDLAMTTDVTDLTVTANFTGTAASPADPGNILVDWGDGSPEEVVEVTGADPDTGAFTAGPTPHTYAEPGEYEIVATYYSSTTAADVQVGTS